MNIIMHSLNCQFFFLNQSIKYVIIFILNSNYDNYIWRIYYFLSYCQQISLIQVIYMERTHLYDNSPEIELNNSLFISQQVLRKDRELQTKSVRNIANTSSIHRNKLAYSRVAEKKEHSKQDFPNMKEGNNRALSIKGGKQIKGLMREQSKEKVVSHEDFNSHLVKLKIEEMVFKFKSRIGTLLKQINISLFDLNRFASLARIDDILNFLSEKVKEKLINTEITENNVTKIRSKERELLSEYQSQIESLKKRLIEKQTIQKTHKQKLKQNHNELRQIYDRLNLKQKQLSIKMTQLYQSKTLLRQSQKLMQTLQGKVIQLQKERNQLREQGENVSKNNNSNNKVMQEENEQLRQENEALREQLEMVEEKEVRLVEFNKNMIEEVARWRERFEEERQKISSKDANHPVDNTSQELSQKNQELSCQVKRLKKELQSLQGYKQKYQAALQLNKKQSVLAYEPQPSQSNKPSNPQSEQLQLKYAKKMQQLSTQWRDKLIQIVDGYAADEQRRKQEIQKLQQEKKALQIKIYTLANEKYLVDCQIIEKETEIYQLTRGIKANKQNQLPSEELLLSSPLIAQEFPNNRSKGLQESRELSSNNQYSYKSQI